MKELSVIIVTRNRLDKLKRCLQSVQEKLPAAEIVVVDNGSTDGTKEYLTGLVAVKKIYSDMNVGVAKGRNLGVSEAKGDHIMFLDDDAWIESLDFPAIKEYFQSHSDVGIVAPRLRYPNGKDQESVRTFPTLMGLFWRGSGLYRLMPNFPPYRRYVSIDPSKVQTVDWAMGACLIIQRSIFDRVGYFDGYYFSVYDDVDFCYRANKYGYDVVYWPATTIYHEYAISHPSQIYEPS